MMLQAQQILQGRYQLKQQLGNNAGRQTWMAEELAAEPGQLVIVKLLPFSPQTHWDDLKLFEREAQVLKHLNHPRIPRYRDYFAIEKDAGNGLPWFALVQDYIPGSSLQQLMKQGKRFTEVEAKQLATQLLNILVYLHELSPPVLHRDIKPSNIIWGKEGQVYLVDFGAVQDRAKAEGATFTVVGTGGYAPPEQLWGQAIPASDLYALGATLIHVLTGTAPIDLPLRKMRLQFKDKVSLTPSFAHWLEKLTDPAPERRFAQVRQALKALQASASSKTSAGKQRTAPKVRYGRIGGLALSQYVALFLFAILVPTFVVYRKHSVNEGNSNIGAMNRAQQAYFMEKGEFSNSVLKLGINIKNPTVNYEYSIRATPLAAFNYATSRQETVKSYVGGVFLTPSNHETDEILTVVILCESQSLGMTPPAAPIVRGNILECGPNTKALGSYTVGNNTGRVVLGKDSALAYNSLQYAAAGQYNKALVVAETIKFKALKEKALKAIATDSSAPNQRVQAIGVSLSQSLNVAKTIEDADIQAWVLANIARRYAATRQKFQAAGIFSQALQVAQTIKDTDTKAMVLADIASEVALGGQQSQAEPIFAQAHYNAETITDVDNQASVLTYIAQTYAAASLYDQVLKAVESIKDSYVKDRVSEASAQELATARQYNHALKVAQTLTATIKDNHDKERALEALVRELAASGRYNQALKVVETIKDDETKEKALQAIAGYRKSPRRIE